MSQTIAAQDTFQEKLPAGLLWRPATLADAPAVTVLTNRCSQKYIGQDDAGEEVMVSFWQTPEFDMSQGTRVVEAADGRIVAYIDLDDSAAPPVLPYLWGRVDPDFEGQGIGSLLLEWAEDRAQAALARVPADVQVAIHTGVWQSNRAAGALFQQHGYQHVRDFWTMTIDLDQATAEPLWPDGISLTTFAAHGDLEALVIAEQDSFRDHWGYVEHPVAQMIEQWRHWLATDSQLDPAGWLLAMDGDTIAGFSLCRRQEYGDSDKGWISVLGVRRPYRRQGLGLALLQQSFFMFKAMGRKRAGLGVDAASLTGATRLYEKAGMVVQRRDLAFEKVIRAGRDITTS